MLDKLSEAGFGKDELTTLQKIIDAEKSDLFDVLEFIAYSIKPITRETRVASAQKNIFAMLESNQKEFLEFVLSKYIETGVEELDQEKLPGLLELKYHAVTDAAEKLAVFLKSGNCLLSFRSICIVVRLLKMFFGFYLSIFYYGQTKYTKTCT